MHDRVIRALGDIAMPRGRRVLLGSAAAVLVGIGLVFGFVMTEWHADVGRALGASGQSVASAVAHEVDRNVELLDISIQAIAREWGTSDVRDLPPRLRDLVLFDNSMRAPGFG